MHLLASILEVQGKYQAAEKSFQQVLYAREKLLGGEHPDTLGSVDRLVSFLRYQRKYERAKKMNERAYERLRVRRCHASDRGNA